MNVNEIKQWLKNRIQEVEEIGPHLRGQEQAIACGSQAGYEVLLELLQKDEGCKHPKRLNADRLLNDAFVDTKKRTLCIDLEHPRVEENVRALKIGLSDVRGSDGIRVSYDFDRDGWVIEQASIFSWDPADEVQDDDWKEVALVQSWARTWDCPGCNSVVSETRGHCEVCGHYKTGK